MDCQSCDDKLKQERGHDTTGIVPFWVEGKQVFRCPLTFITPISWDLIKAYGLYEKGFLPNGVGWNNESQKFVQAMQLLDNEFIKWKNILAEKGNKNAPSRTRHNT